MGGCLSKVRCRSDDTNKGGCLRKVCCRSGGANEENDGSASPGRDGETERSSNKGRSRRHKRGDQYMEESKWRAEPDYKRILNKIGNKPLNFVRESFDRHAQDTGKLAPVLTEDGLYALFSVEGA